MSSGGSDADQHDPDPGQHGAGGLGASQPILQRENAEEEGNQSRHPHRVRNAAREAGLTLAFLPFRSPELMPREALWRGLKAVLAPNRCEASVEELADRAADWLDVMTMRNAAAGCIPPSSTGYLLRPVRAVLC
jgi:hypothetical protein